MFSFPSTYPFKETEEEEEEDSPDFSSSLRVSSSAQNDHLRGPFFKSGRVLLGEVGCGSFGAVYRNYRRSDRRIEVTKFIVKEKVRRGNFCIVLNSFIGI